MSRADCILGGEPYGIFPKRVDTVLAEVLAYMLQGFTTTGMQSVLAQNTTRLAAHVHRAACIYNWPIDRATHVVGTNDGREVPIAVYWLSCETREAAFRQGARVWIEQVMEARACRRKLAPLVKASAAAKNSIRQARTNDPRQGNLWGAS